MIFIREISPDYIRKILVASGSGRVLRIGISPTAELGTNSSHSPSYLSPYSQEMHLQGT